MEMQVLRQILGEVVGVVLGEVVLVGLVRLVKVQQGAMVLAVPVMGVVVAAAHLRLVQMEQQV